MENWRRSGWVSRWRDESTVLLVLWSSGMFRCHSDVWSDTEWSGGGWVARWRRFSRVSAPGMSSRALCWTFPGMMMVEGRGEKPWRPGREAVEAAGESGVWGGMTLSPLRFTEHTAPPSRLRRFVTFKRTSQGINTTSYMYKTQTRTTTRKIDRAECKLSVGKQS